MVHYTLSKKEVSFEDAYAILPILPILGAQIQIIKDLHIGMELTQEIKRNPKTRMDTDLIMMLLCRPNLLDWLTFGSLEPFT